MLLLGGICAAISLLLFLCSLEVCDDVINAVEGGSATGTAALLKPWFVVELEGLIVVKFYWFGYLGCARTHAIMFVMGKKNEG